MNSNSLYEVEIGDLHVKMKHTQVRVSAHLGESQPVTGKTITEATRQALNEQRGEKLKQYQEL